MTAETFFELLRIFGLCAAATLSYAMLLRTPKRALIISALLGSAGYTVLLVSDRYFSNIMVSYFLGALLVSIIGELIARIMKIPSTIFVIPAIIPLVPGYGLYMSMLKLVQNDFNGFIKTGVQTFFIAGIIAAAIALTNFAARRLFPARNAIKK